MTHRRRALQGFNRGLTYSEDPRRELPISITWDRAVMGRVKVGGEYWTAVEWSETHQCWCIEDSRGACLKHIGEIRGAAESKEAAVALAEAMIREPHADARRRAPAAMGSVATPGARANRS